MTQTERNLWEMARLAVRTGKEEETFRDLKSQGNVNNLQLFSFYLQLRKTIEKQN